MAFWLFFCGNQFVPCREEKKVGRLDKQEYSNNISPAHLFEDRRGTGNSVSGYCPITVD